MLYFLEKAGKNRRSVGGSVSKLLLASGDWGLCPQTPKLLFPLNLRVILSTTRISWHR